MSPVDRDADPMLLLKGGAVLLDVRTATEFADEHLEGAVNMPLGRLRQNFGQLDPKKVYLVYCSHGLRSIKAVSLLMERGFLNAVNAGTMASLAQQGARVVVLP